MSSSPQYCHPEPFCRRHIACRPCGEPHACLLDQARVLTHASRAGVARKGNCAALARKHQHSATLKMYVQDVRGAPCTHTPTARCAACRPCGRPSSFPSTPCPGPGTRRSRRACGAPGCCRARPAARQSPSASSPPGSPCQWSCLRGARSTANTIFILSPSITHVPPVFPPCPDAFAHASAACNSVPWVSGSLQIVSKPQLSACCPQIRLRHQ